MPNGLLVGQDIEIASWIYARYRLFPRPVDKAFGIVSSKGELIGAILLYNYNGSNIEIGYYGPKTMTPGIIRTIAKTLISELRANRITVITSKKNKRLMRSLVRFGFRLEGTQRCYYGEPDCAKNTGVRFVGFRDLIERVAGIGKKTTNADNTTAGL